MADFRRFALAAALACGTLGCTSVRLSDESLAGYWRVTAVNGQGIPARGDYHMQFADRRVGASFGCNQMGGAYEVYDNVLRIDGLTSTLMGCPEPSATIEHNATTVLNDEMRIAAMGEGRVRLYGASGSIELRR